MKKLSAIGLTSTLMATLSTGLMFGFAPPATADEIVTEEGEVVQLLDDGFILDTGTEEIAIDTYPLGERDPLDLTVGESVSVYGELDDDDAEIDAFTITREDGSTIEIPDDDD
ncbi:hypothetical protein [Phormidium sp. CCY1219]|uniref:hypothetical protein n=1 Tax=Phormidium sp. CCY1219 TaxID=2886104 RepID=UPI002D1F7512|nr:hypothetical protein [Phormidium sp. CCY1219]MEB3830982.1 hypothetical protein [Phormidium sp. CCY1219]